MRRSSRNSTAVVGSDCDADSWIKRNRRIVEIAHAPGYRQVTSSDLNRWDVSRLYERDDAPPPPPRRADHRTAVGGQSGTARPSRRPPSGPAAHASSAAASSPAVAEAAATASPSAGCLVGRTAWDLRRTIRMPADQDQLASQPMPTLCSRSATSPMRSRNRCSRSGPVFASSREDAPPRAA